MKKVEIFIGSPRKKGNTVILADALKKNLDGAGVKADITHLYDFHIKPCVDCRACRRELQECRAIDDMHRLRPKIERADVLVFGTPIYWFGPSGKTKLFMDRMRPYFLNKHLKGKKCALIMPASAGEEDSDLTIEMFKRMSKALEMDFIGAVTSKAFEVGESSDDSKAMKEIEKLARKIVG